MAQRKRASKRPDLSSLAEPADLERLAASATVKSTAAATPNRGLGPIFNSTITQIIKRELPRSQPQLLRVPDKAFPNLFKATISIGDTGPEEWIENRQGWVQFTVVNFTRSTIPASFVKLTVKPKESLQSYPGNFEFPIDELPTFGLVQGALSFLIPRADVGNTLTLTWYTYGPSAGEFPPTVIIDTAALDFDVAAKFTVSMNKIFIRNTASHHNDTLYVALTGQQNDTIFSETAALGDHDNTDGRNGIDASVASVGPFILVPKSNEVISVSGLITNNGHSSKEDDDKEILDTISKAPCANVT